MRFLFQKIRLLKKKGVVGHTLMELIIYMGIFGLLLVVISQLLSVTLDVRRESEAVSYTAQSARYILARMTYDIRRASAIVTPSSLGAQSTSLVLTIGGVANTYQLTDSNLTLNGVQVNGFETSVSDLDFTRLGNSGGKNAIRVSYTVRGRVLKRSGEETVAVQTAIGLR